MGTTLPTSASKANSDASTDDPKQSILVDLAGVVDKFNALLTALGAGAQLNLGGGLATTSEGAGTPNKVYPLTVPRCGVLWNLTGARNATTTAFDLSAAQIILVDANRQPHALTVGAHSVTINAATAGPAANGRDQAGSFSNQWLHLYFIWNGTALAGICSATAPDAGGPTLPSGYTHWAYATTLYYTTAFRDVYVRGDKVFYSTLAQGSAGVLTATSVTLLPVSALVPTIAKTYSAQISGSCTVDGSGNINVGFFISDAAQNNRVTGFSGNVQGLTAGSTYSSDSVIAELANIANYYYWIGANTGKSAGFHVQNYAVPNGAL